MVLETLWHAAIERGDMANPIVGPTTSIESNALDGIGSFYLKRIRYRQAKPFNKAMPYLREWRFVLSASKAFFGDHEDPSPLGYSGLAYSSELAAGIHPFADTPAYGSNQVNLVLNEARAKFGKKVSDRSETLVNLIEARRSVAMMANRATQLLKLVRSVNRFDVGGVVDVLKSVRGNERPLPRGEVTRVRRAVVRGKPAANIWLELHFGWAPLISDVQASMNLLESDFSPRPIYASTKHVVPKWGRVAQSDGPGYSSTTQVWHNITLRGKVGATIRIENPNLFLAQRMGLINPLTVINETIPFSFVLDWFSNWSQWLGQYSEFYGLDLINPYHTWSFEKWSSYEGRGSNWFNPIGNHRRTVQAYHFLVERKLDLPSVSLGLRLPQRLSITRAATAVSLILQQVKRWG